LLLELLLSAHRSGRRLCEFSELHNDLGYGRGGVDLDGRGCAQPWFYLGQMPQDEGLLAGVFPVGIVGAVTLASIMPAGALSSAMWSNWASNLPWLVLQPATNR
jgi:hypothetical protein